MPDLLPGEIPDEILRAARAADPGGLLEGLGFEVQRPRPGAIEAIVDGKKIYGLEADQDGVWKVLDADGLAIGDLVDFVRRLLSLPFRLAVAVLSTGVAPAGSDGVAADVAGQHGQQDDDDGYERGG